MCGICGFTGSLGQADMENNYQDMEMCRQEKENLLNKMQEKIHHRGPDSQGMFISEECSMGFCRLSIIDLQRGHQPIYNEDDTMVITFNGEIYNHEELRDELIQKGHVMSSKADTEVLIHGYEEYGEDILQKIRGMFAFVIWDKKNSTLFAARDHFGIKPFYYSVCDGNLIYGSEIKSILEYPYFKNGNKKVNEKALENYLTFQYSVLPETFFKDIYRLLPGHSFTFKKGILSIKRYWQPVFEPDNSKSLETFIDEIDSVVQKSIMAHKISDVEVGSFLSSGVDSSYVASTFKGDKTFTVGFDYSKYNEISYAKSLSDTINITNHSKVIRPNEYWNNFPKIQYHMDEPLADPAAVALYFVSQTASKHVKVALSGEGADEFFGGYNIYHEPESLKVFSKLGKPLRKVIGTVATSLPNVKGKNYLIRGSKTVEERFIGNAFLFTKKEREKVLANPTGDYDHMTLTKSFYKDVEHLDDVTKMQYIDVNFWLVGDILLKADKMSMAHSLEVRVPLVDKEVFDLARTLPTDKKINKKNTKYAFREAAKRHLPEDTAKKKKLGFPVPIRIWLKEEKYFNHVKDVFTNSSGAYFFNTKELIGYLNDHKNDVADNSRKIWAIYTFLIWHEVYFNDLDYMNYYAIEENSNNVEAV